MTREEAIERLKNYTQYRCGGVDLVAINMAIQALEQVPKTGHWVKKSQYGNDYCSECDYELLMRGKPKFCPNCGTKMESEG
jgi:hypothetical protein